MNNPSIKFSAKQASHTRHGYVYHAVMLDRGHGEEMFTNQRSDIWSFSKVKKAVQRMNDYNIGLDTSVSELSDFWTKALYLEEK
jgi:uncharacterized protein (UPF0548 family)